MSAHKLATASIGYAARVMTCDPANDERNGPRIPFIRREGLVLRCTPESILNDQISVAAVIETFICVMVYAALAVYCGNHGPFFLSAAVVLLFLLRSDESIAEGEHLLAVYWSQRTESLTRIFKGQIFVATLLVAGAIVCLSAWNWLPETPGVSLFVTAFALGAVFCALTGIVPVAVIGPVTFTEAVIRGSKMHVVVAMAVVICAASASVGVVSGPLAATGTLGGAVVCCAIFWISIPGFEDMIRGKTDVPKVPVLAATASLGVLARTLWIRFIATGKHLPQGFRELPRNWRQTLWVIDAGSAPMPIPGAERVDERFTVWWWWRRVCNEPRFPISAARLMETISPTC